MLSIQNSQNNSYRPSFGMNFGKTFSKIRAEEFASKRIDNATNMILDVLEKDKKTEHLFFDLVENLEFPYKPNTFFAPRFYLDVAVLNKETGAKKSMLIKKINENSDMRNGFTFKDIVGKLIGKKDIVGKHIDKEFLKKVEKMVLTGESTKVVPEDKPVPYRRRTTPEEKRRLAEANRRRKGLLITGGIDYGIDTIRENYGNVKLGKHFDRLLYNTCSEGIVRLATYRKIIDRILKKPEYKGMTFEILPIKRTFYNDFKKKFYLSIKFPGEKPFVYVSPRGAKEFKVYDILDFLSIRENVMTSKNPKLPMINTDVRRY